MRARKWEFEQRFWVFGFIFFVGFGLYALDHVNTVQWLVFQLLPPAKAHGAAGEQLARLIFLAGVALVFAVALFRTWATAYLKTEVVHDQAQHAETVLAAGPYRYTRNPLYFGNLFLAIGSGLMASRAGLVLGTGHVSLRVHVQPAGLFCGVRAGFRGLLHQRKHRS
jgi:steroid 5-alpha reductase family enzyme